MAVFERSFVVDAPFDDVWQFHTSIEGLIAVTPDWLGLTVETVTRPDGESAAGGRLIEGSEISLTIRPFGRVHLGRWQARVTHVDRGTERAEIRDELLDGPFTRWLHSHRFRTVSGGTRVTDRVEYELPLGPLRALSSVARPGFAAMFAHRHRRTRQLLE